MSSQIGPYVPLLIVAMVTWKVANSPSTSYASATSTSTYPYRTASSQPKNAHVNAWGSSISERLSARSMASSSSSFRSHSHQARRLMGTTADVRHSRTGSSSRSLAAGTNGHGRRGSRPMSPAGTGGMRMGGAGGRITGGVAYGTRGPAAGGRR